MFFIVSFCRAFLKLFPSLSCSFSRKYRLASDGLVPGLDKRPRRTFARSPRAVPWEKTLPWAAVMISQSAAAVPVRDDRGRGSACAKAVDASTSRGVGTSVTARIPNACAQVRRWQAARRQARRRQDEAVKAQHAEAERARRQRATVCAASAEDAGGCGGAWSRSKNFFPTPLCDRPGCYEPPPKSGRNQARYCCPACRQAVRRVLDRERKWRSRGTFQGRRERAARSTRPPARGGRGEPRDAPATDAITAAAAVTRPAGRAGRQLIAWLRRLA